MQNDNVFDGMTGARVNGIVLEQHFDSMADSILAYVPLVLLLYYKSNDQG